VTLPTACVLWEANTTARIDYEKMVGNPKTSLVGQLVL